MLAKRLSFLAVCLTVLVSACAPLEPAPAQAGLSSASTAAPTPSAAPSSTPLPTRPPYLPGTLVDYTAQPGDTLDVLALRFHTTVAEIRANNPALPAQATFLDPGLAMKIPIYYQPLWGSPYQILPDELFVNGPAQVGFNAGAFISGHPGWLKDYRGPAGSDIHSAGEIIEMVARDYSVSPRLLLAVAEYMSGALTNPNPPDDPYMLGRNDYHSVGFYRQLAWVADVLNNNYYDWRSGKLLSFEHLDSRMERPDPWQNAATVALQRYFSLFMDGDAYTRAISGSGLAKTYASLFGNPWINVQPHLPGSLEQPALRLPFEPGYFWAFTGGPHNAWGDQVSPLAAIDFAPPSVVSGCMATDQWATAMADGVIVRTGVGIAVLDLDGDGDERTGWDIFYLHLETATIRPVGTHLKAGERIGRPSCEGGHATGTHVHIARKYNGEWILAEGALAYNLEGWTARNGAEPYEGMLLRGGKTISACTCSDQASQLESTAAPVSQVPPVNQASPSAP